MDTLQITCTSVSVRIPTLERCSIDILAQNYYLIEAWRWHCRSQDASLSIASHLCNLVCSIWTKGVPITGD